MDVLGGKIPDLEGLDFLPFRENDRLLGFIGTVGIHAGPNATILKVDARAKAANPQGILHGGALSALCDVAMYESAKGAFGGDCVTSVQDMKFLRPFRTDAPLFIISEVLRAGRTTALCAVRAVQGGKLGAFSTGQFTRI